MQPPTAVPLETLTHAHRFLRAGFGRNMLVPVDDAFFAKLTDSDSPLAAGALLNALSKLAADEANVPPCKAIIKRVAAVVPGSRDGEFMAPMCCPLTKTNLADIADPSNGYLVTEKSDGVRVVLYSEAIAAYPRWVRVDDANAPVASEPLGLLDQAMIEGAWREMLSDGAAYKAGLHLTVGTGKLTPCAADDTGDVMVLRLMPNGSQELVDVRLQRRKGTRHFTFLFDRSMMATYLMLEESPFPTGLTRIVLDGELILSYPPTPRGQPMPRPGCVFAVFDLLSYHKVVADGGEPERELIFDASMSERYDMINDDVLMPAQERARAELIPFSRAVRIMRKTMVKVADIGSQIVAQLAVLPRPAEHADRPVSADHDAQYFFLPTCSFNDGLIFTPDKFDVAAGSCPNQFKWKWPGKLSVDFVVQPSPLKTTTTDEVAPSDADGPVDRCDVSLLFKQRGTNNQPDRFGHVQVATEYLYNPDGVRLSSKENPRARTVVECCLARGKATGAVRWRIDRVRSDKTEANAMITAFSVLESIAENITIARLCEGLRVPLAPELAARFPVVSDAVVGAALPDVPDLRMILRARISNGRALPSLQWQVRLPDMKKSSLTCNHRPVHHCYGLGEPCPAEQKDQQADPLASVLVGRALLEIGNHGGCVGWSDTTCAAAFDARTGRWAFGDISGDAEKKATTWCTHVFAHLAALGKYAVATGGAQPELPLIAQSQPQVDKTAGQQEQSNPGTAAPVLAPSDAHYAQRTRELAVGTGRSALRKHNNWIKAVVLATACHQARQTATNKDALHYLDLCCGRGGDLHKIAAMPVARAMLIDSCFEAVVEAAGRYSTGNGLSTCSVQHKGLPMAFRVSDCFDVDATMPVVADFISAHDALRSQGGFDVVSCQFSFHYAFRTERQVRGFLGIVSRSLRSGGIFAGTTVDDEALMSWRQRCGDSFGNADFHVEFLPEGSGATEYGAAYRITVQNSVVDEVEYVVEWPRFVAMCAEYGLELVETKNFHAVTDAALAGTAHSDMVEKLLGGGGQSAGSAGGRAAPAHQKRGRAPTADLREEMTKDESEVAGLFRTVILRKQ